MITTITWINTNHDQIWLLKEESEPMRGRWSASNFSWTRGGGGRDTSSRGHFLSGGFIPLILAYQNTCYVLHSCSMEVLHPQISSLFRQLQFPQRQSYDFVLQQLETTWKLHQPALSAWVAWHEQECGVISIVPPPDTQLGATANM